MVGLPCGLLQGDTAGGGRGSALQPGSVPVGRALQAWSLIRTPILISSAPLITMQPADGIWCVDGGRSPVTFLQWCSQHKCYSWTNVPLLRKE